MAETVLAFPTETRRSIDDPRQLRAEVLALFREAQRTGLA